VSEQVVGVASDTSGTATLQVQSATVESVTNVTSDALSVYQVNVSYSYSVEGVGTVVSDTLSVYQVNVSYGYSVEEVKVVVSDTMSVYQVSVLQVNVPYNVEVIANIASDVFAVSTITVSVQQPTTKVGGGVSLPWYVWALIALFVIDVLSSRRRRR